MSNAMNDQLVIDLGTGETAVALPRVADVDGAVELWLRSEVANGDPQADTIRGYQQDFRIWLTWCEVNGVDPGLPSRQNIEAYRAELVQAGLQAPTISRRLTVVRRFYGSAKDRGLIPLNPAAGVKAPIDRRIKDRKKTLSAGQAERLLEALPPVDTLRGLRDRAIVGLLLLEGLRRVELHRANDQDLSSDLLGYRLLIHGKGRDRAKILRTDTAAALLAYLKTRGKLPSEKVLIHRQETLVAPLFTAINKADRTGGRISRIGLNHIIDGYLTKAGIKREGLSCHALRHTFGTLLYQQTKDLRAVQDELGHAQITTSAIYADSGHDEARYAERVPLRLSEE